MALVALESGTADAASIVLQEVQGHPRVVLTSDELAGFRARSQLDWARPIRARILAEADALVDEPLDIPRKEGQWIHWYSCTQDGIELTPLDPHRHMCPGCGTVYSGHPYDAVYVALRHDHWLGGVATLGLAYALEPEPRYAARAREILLEYASFYGDLRLHNKHDKRTSSKARLYAQTLDEATILCRIVLGYDLVYDAPVFTASDRETINRRLLRAMVRTIQPNRAGISNWQSWHNAAVGMVGLLLRDEKLVKWAIDGQQGFNYQMRRSLMGTGMWYEESPIYHWYALRAHVYLLEGATRAGIPLYEHPKVRGMFEAPLRIALPDGTMPPINDSDRMPVDRAILEVAQRRFGGALFAPWLEPRDSEWALLWGVSNLPRDVAPRAARSSNSASEGLAVLRNPENSIVAMLEYGPGLSGHVQPAKLNLLLYAFDDIRLVDPGRISYGNPLHKQWYTQTVAHNTVAVNGRSQARTRGELRAFASEPAIIRAVSSTAYPDVMLDRTVLLHENLLLDVFRCQARRNSVFDLPLHLQGILEGLPEGVAGGPLGGSAGYQHLEGVVRYEQPLTALDLDTGAGRIHLRFAGPSEFYTAAGPGNPPTERIPVVLQRQRGREALFITVYEMLDQHEEPRAGEIAVQTLAGGHAVSFAGIRLELGDGTTVETDQRRIIGREGAAGP
jgi:oligo-alginate lyase